MTSVLVQIDFTAQFFFWKRSIVSEEERIAKDVMVLVPVLGGLTPEATASIHCLILWRATSQSEFVEADSPFKFIGTAKSPHAL